MRKVIGAGQAVDRGAAQPSAANASSPGSANAPGMEPGGHATFKRTVLAGSKTSRVEPGAFSETGGQSVDAASRAVVQPHRDVPTPATAARPSSDREAHTLSQQAPAGDLSGIDRGCGPRAVSDMGGRVSPRGRQATTERRNAASGNGSITRQTTENQTCRPPMSDVLPVWCIGCGQQAATRLHYPYCSGKCEGAAADYELEKLKDAEKAHAQRKRTRLMNENFGDMLLAKRRNG